MANAPSCTQIITASVWIEYIFKRNAVALSILIIVYTSILSAYILYTNQLEVLSPFNNAIDDLTHSFQTSSFYQEYYIPYIHHYGCNFLLFIVLLPISLMYFDSLFRYRNDCSTISDGWIIFSIIFTIQFWYMCIKFILYNPQFSAINNEATHPRGTSTFDARDFGPNLYRQNNLQHSKQANYEYGAHHIAPPQFQTQYVQPSPSPAPFPELGYTQRNDNAGESDRYQNNPSVSVPSMNAPKPMQNEYFEEEEHGAIPDYNPFDFDYAGNGPGNDENAFGESNNVQGNGGYVVVEAESDNAPLPHYKISVMDNAVTSNTYTTERSGHGYIEQNQQIYNAIQPNQSQIHRQNQPNHPRAPHPLQQPQSPSSSSTNINKQQIKYEQESEIEVSEYENEIRFSESKNSHSHNAEATEYRQGIEMKQFIKNFKYTTIYFMLLCPFTMATTWMLIPYYAGNAASYLSFYALVAPFLIIYRINMRFMRGNYYNHYNYTNILNDFPFLIFLVKMSSVNIIVNFCTTLLMNPWQNSQHIAGMILLFIFPICSIYSWCVIGKMSVQLRCIYIQFEALNRDNNVSTFICPIIPFGEIPYITTADSDSDSEAAKIIYDEQKQATDSDRLESVDLTGNDQQTQFRQSKYSVHNTVTVIDNSSRAKLQLRRVASIGAIHYSQNRFWIMNITLIISSIVSIIAGSVEASIAKRQMDSVCYIAAADNLTNQHCFEAAISYSTAMALVFFAVILLFVGIYNVVIECCNANSKKGINTKVYLMGSDSKQRLVVWIKVMLSIFIITIILMTKRNGTKVIFTILSFTSSIFLAVLTFNNKYKILSKLPFKNPKMFATCYLISYLVSSLVMAVMIIHAISVSGKQILPIYSYVGLSFVWLFWSLFYNNEMQHFIAELNDIPSMKMDESKQDIDVFNRRRAAEKFKIKHGKQMATTYGSLYLLNELVMVSSFMVFIICCAMASKSYEGAQDGASLFFLSIYLSLSCIIFINSFVAILSMQSKNEKVYKAAAFEPFLKESLLL